MQDVAEKFVPEANLKTNWDSLLPGDIRRDFQSIERRSGFEEISKLFGLTYGGRNDISEKSIISVYVDVVV